MLQLSVVLAVGSVTLNVWALLRLRRIAASRKRIHASFRNVSRVNGKCQCPYCRHDASDLAELAANYELDLWSLQRKYEPVQRTRRGGPS